MNNTSAGGLAIASLVLGLVGLFAWFCPLIGLPITVVGLVLGIKSLRSPNRGMAIAGVILSSVGLLLTLVNAAVGAYLGATGQHPLFQRPVRQINSPAQFPSQDSDPYHFSTVEDEVLGTLTMRSPKAMMFDDEVIYSLPGYSAPLTKEEIAALKANPTVKNHTDAIRVLQANRRRLVDDFLLELLATGPVSEETVVQQARTLPIPRRAAIQRAELDEASSRLGIIRTTDMTWQLPEKPEATVAPQ